MHRPQRLRPKHQLLILKCYPKFQKSKLEVKPNSSELSYLLYYASTRRSKLQKVGAFLEKKTAHDVSSSRIGNVQVTLQILRALIEKCSRELPLFASYLLRILDRILQSKDITLLEDSVPTFDTFCANRDSATLSADEAYGRLYDQVTDQYISFASKEAPPLGKGLANVPLSLRYRTAGLRAIKSMVSSDSLLLESNRHLRQILPVILQNLYSGNTDYLSILQTREQEKEKFNKDQSLRRRQSTSAGHATDANETDPSTAGDTTADLDRRADEDVGVLALQSLRQIFSANNRGQLRSSTHTVLNFVTDQAASPKSQTVNANWHTGLFETLCRWTPVQDRFVVLVVIMEAFVRSPMLEKDLPRQLMIVRIVSWMLQSDIIYIGLSVMDVLNSLIQRIIMLLQLGREVVQLFAKNAPGLTLSKSEMNMEFARQSTLTKDSNSSLPVETVEKPSEARMEMLQELGNCVANLATHNYYSDQISDMVSALLQRLKPTPSSNLASAISAIQDPIQTRDNIADSVNLVDNPNADQFFSFDTARLLALRAVKQILKVANTSHAEGGNAVIRNRVQVSVWEGTQWLLRDPSGEVRTAYVDSLLTWLHVEMDKVDARVIEAQIKPLSFARKAPEQMTNGGLAKRAVSNASHKKKEKRPSNSSFLQLLHLAIYENALQRASSELDVVLLHLLATSIVRVLGINSVRYGLSMMFRLQDDLLILPKIHSHMCVASLVLGYFWSVVEEFDLEDSRIGQEIQNEISQRQKAGMWLEAIQSPPLPLEDIGKLPDAEALPGKTFDPDQSIVIQPFQSRRILVDSIGEAYSEMPLSPPSSPPLVPHRRFSLSGPNNVRVPQLASHAGRPFPERVREQMLRDWTKESCTAAAEIATAKTTSLTGSKAATATATISGGHNNLLAVDTVSVPANGFQSNGNTKYDQLEDRGRPSSAIFGLMGGRSAMSEALRQRSHGSSPRRVSNSSSQSVMRVRQLKGALTGNYSTMLQASGAAISQSNSPDRESDSMVSDDITVSDVPPTSHIPSSNGIPRERQDHIPRPRSSGSSRSPPLRPSTDAKDTDIPPVPPLPPALHIQSETPLSDDFEKQMTSNLARQASGEPALKHNSSPLYKNSIDEDFGASNMPASGKRRTLDELLNGISPNGPRPGSSVGRPPY